MTREKRRGRFELISAYLELPVATKYQRLKHADTTYCCGVKYHDLLIREGFLEPSESPAESPTESPTFKTTKKGWRLVGMIEGVLEMLGWGTHHTRVGDPGTGEQT